MPMPDEATLTDPAATIGIMTQVQPQDIRLGSGRPIGKVSVDGSAVRGEGGAAKPQLVIPLMIEMNQQPEEAALALVSLHARLAFDEHASPDKSVSQPISLSLARDFPALSQPHGPANHEASLRFYLTPADVEDLERYRHRCDDDSLQVFLALDPTVAALRTYNSFGSKPDLEPTPWDMRFGMFSQVLPFWTVRMQSVRVLIDQSTWVRKVLPGLGYDRRRLLELSFPPPLPDHGSAATQFDKATRALYERRYGDCIQDCRGLLNMWEKHYGATGKTHIAERLAAARGWAAEDIRVTTLDELWKATGDIANAPHHPEGKVDAELFDSRDARLILVLTAALSEYVAEL